MGPAAIIPFATTIIGTTTAAVGAFGGGFGGAVIATGVTVFYSYLKRHLQTQIQPLHEKLNKIEEAIKNIKQWQKIVCPDEQFQMIDVMPEKQFKQQCQLFSCPLTRLVIHEPVYLQCCHKFFQKDIILFWLNQKKSCPLCTKSITQDEIVRNAPSLNIFRKEIVYFRLKIRKTFIMLNESTVKEHWKNQIDCYMGEGYTEKYL